MVFNKEFFLKYAIIFIAFLFVVLRIFGIGVPYHQDEVKWVANSVYSGQITSGMGHPPLTSLFFQTDAFLFGDRYFRMMPFILSLVNLFLMYLFLLKHFSRAAAIWGSLIFSIVFYSFLGSVMVDTDGSVLPFFFIISIFAYFNMNKTTILKYRIWWGTVLMVGLMSGILTKLSFILTAGAIGIDFLCVRRHLIKLRHAALSVVFAAFIGSVLALIAFKTGVLSESFDATRIVGHAADYFKFSDRNYFQTFFQVAKAMMYGSPLLFLPILLMPTTYFKKTVVLLFYVGLNTVFYIFIFDFSSGTIDKYLLALVMPLSILNGIVLAEIFQTVGKCFWVKPILVGCGLAALIVSLQFLPHSVPPLYPKSEWISKVVDLKWSFLIPFTGGSGPMGFYVSWLFIGITWLVSGVLLVLGIIFREARPKLMIIIFLLGMGYNGVFAEEYLLGKINGNSALLLNETLKFIKNNPQIGKLMTYNDIGGIYLMNMKRYERRIFVAPKYEKQYVPILNSFKGSYLVIEIPRLSSQSIYARFFSSCKIIKEQQSGKISAKIYDCRRSPNIM